MALTEKQKRFADEYLIDLNATQAAARAGYKDPNFGRQLITKTNVSAYIQQKQKRLQKKTNITQERILAELAAIGFAEATDFAPNGFPIDSKSNYKGGSKLKALELMGRMLGVIDGERQSSGEAVNIIDDL